MALGDLFKSKENAQLKQRVAELEAQLTPEMQDHMQLQQRIEALRQELVRLQMQTNQAQQEYERIQIRQQAELDDLRRKVDSAKQDLVETNEEVLMQSFGLYKPQYEFANSAAYKERLDQIRARQKEMIKAGNAATGNTNWTVNNSLAKGRKMVSDMQKLLLRAFNSECDEAISKVKFSNFDSSVKRIVTSREAISKLGNIMGVAITQPYFSAKMDELHLAYEYQLKKQEEKEEQKRLREEMREQAKVQKELEEAQKEIEKEQKHYQNALSKIALQMESAEDSDLASLTEKKAEIEAHLSELAQAAKDVDYRTANQKAGYVYVISNIGAFGENVYKIGMTRRIDPMERIDELGDASVPFDFDVHAMIFTDDAPGLEAALHRAFEDRKLNMINTRREFFHVSLDEIKKVVRENYDKTVEFVDIPEAEQYRQSMLLRNEKREELQV